VIVFFITGSDGGKFGKQSIGAHRGFYQEEGIL